MSNQVDAHRPYLPRLVDPVLREILGALPAVSLVGPRATGKTTAATQLAASIARIDRPNESAAFRVDADAALARMDRPTLIDEWHLVPEVLGAVKRAVDADGRPGQFVMTGSVRPETQDTWPATGRLVRLPVFGLTQREIVGSRVPLFVDRIAENVRTVAQSAPSDLTVFDYLGLAEVGGFPTMALAPTSGPARARWLQSYLHELRTADVKLAGGSPDAGKFQSFVEAMALSSSRIIDQATLQRLTGVTKNTAAAYEGLLEAVYFCERVPAWRSDRLDRLAALPKRYVLDTALLMHVWRMDVDQAARDPHVLGAVLDTFVAAQLRPEVSIQPRPPAWMHLRDKGGRHEVDLILELAPGKVVGIEVKATAAPGVDDARHLIWLRDQLGPGFVGGVVLHTGPASFMLSPRIAAAPISSIWQG
jgi:predicted AAA+ superfamily ATPase